MGQFRVERDSMGELKVPANALYGAQTQRAVNNFPISGLTMPREFIQALGLIKVAAAKANLELGILEKETAEAIVTAALQVSEGQYDAHFPIDVFQTGSGTSTNMNANEVISHLASAYSGLTIHPNDHVNMGQSSNDVIPTAIQVSIHLSTQNNLIPGLNTLIDHITERAQELSTVVKTGRTHLMDAMPITFGQELGTWVAQLSAHKNRLEESSKRITALPQGGTAVGTGINAHPEFAAIFAQKLSQECSLEFSSHPNKFLGIASQDPAVEQSSIHKGIAVTLMKISNDLRWMNSGPLAGIGDIELPSLQPGSSIMPGKVNPVIPEALTMLSAQVMGNDVTITVAGQSGNFQLNVMLPVIALNALQSIKLLSNGMQVLASSAIKGFKVRTERINESLNKNPILVTALNPVIGYEKGAATAKLAYKTGRPIIDVALEQTDLSEEELKKLLNPLHLTEGGIGE
ncbi:MAG: class II fumarate hydratase [bacterium]